MSFFPFDEINALKAEGARLKSPDTEPKKEEVDKYIDEVEDLFILTYFYGNREIADQFGLDILPNEEKAREVINEKFDGKDFKDRLSEYLISGTGYDIDRVLDTDAGRIYEAAKFNAAKEAGATTKTWNTMLDDRVRDTHDYLEGVTIPLDAEFYTYNGNHSYYPRQFLDVSENANCRCWLTYDKE